MRRRNPALGDWRFASAAVLGLLAMTTSCGESPDPQPRRKIFSNPAYRVAIRVGEEFAVALGFHSSDDRSSHLQLGRPVPECLEYQGEQRRSLGGRVSSTAGMRYWHFRASRAGEGMLRLSDPRQKDKEGPVEVVFSVIVTES